MARVTFILANGAEKEVELKPGARLVNAGYAAGLDAVGFGDCGGNCTCGTCHVRVKEGTFPAASADEQAVLDTFPKPYQDSRLACQLRLPDEGDVVLEWVP